MSPVVLDRLTADDWRTWRQLRLAALAEAPYAFASTLADWTGDGDAEGRWRGRLSAVPLNLVATIDGKAVGMTSATAPLDGELELISMWVAPEARGKGVGGRLVEAVVAWARTQQAHRVSLDVREENLRAISLYTRLGFADAGSSANSDPGFPERRMVMELS